MTRTVLIEEIDTQDNSLKVRKWTKFFIWKIAIATLLLMAVGSATRVMNAGLACPDWPLCYGQLIPTRQMNLQVFLEWFHRLDASLIGISTIILLMISCWFREQLPRWLPWSALLALALILFQGVLGGLTVTRMLRFDIVTAHLGTALLFFGVLVIIALSLSTPLEAQDNSNLRWIGLLVTCLVYVQCLLGGLVGSRWALHQCFEESQLCTVMNSHIIGVIPTTLGVLSLVLMAWRTSNLHPSLKKLVWLAGGIVMCQILLGTATFYLHLQVEPLTIAHHTVGVMLFGTLVALTTLAMRSVPRET
ncbi:MAG: heme A synthase [Candidatus Atelocyanobacterium thalassa]